MCSDNIVDLIKSEMKVAMKSRDKFRLQTIRLIRAEFKRIELDERVTVNNDRVLIALDKMLKQRRDSIEYFQNAGRTDLAEKELSEIEVIQEFLPAPMSKEQIELLINEALAATEETGMQAMGKVMGLIKPKIQGRANIGHVSELVKAKLIG